MYLFLPAPQYSSVSVGLVAATAVFVGQSTYADRYTLSELLCPQTVHSVSDPSRPSLFILVLLLLLCPLPLSSHEKCLCYFTEFGSNLKKKKQLLSLFFPHHYLNCFLKFNLIMLISLGVRLKYFYIYFQSFKIANYCLDIAWAQLFLTGGS